MAKPSKQKDAKEQAEKLGGKAYEQALRKLHVELVKLQESCSGRRAGSTVR